MERIIQEINETITNQDTRISELETEVKQLRHDLNNSRAAVSMLKDLLEAKHDKT